MIAISQMQVHPQNPEKNMNKIIEDINRAKDMGKDMIVFPELAVPGYMLGDSWEQNGFVRDCISMNEEIIESTKGKITAIWGNVYADEDNIGEDGRLRKYNSAYIASDGKLVTNPIFNGVIHKTLMPKYRMFDDRRHFTSMQNMALENGKNINDYFEPFDVMIEGIKKKVGITICEDLWDDTYSVKPVTSLKQNGADIIVNLSSSPYYIGKHSDREELLRRQSEDTSIYYTNNVGVQNNGKNYYIMDGDSAIYKGGKKVSSRVTLHEAIIIEEKEKINDFEYSEIAAIHKKIVYGIREFFKQIRKEKVIIGLSGGLDSAVVAALMVEAIGKENVIAINMPSRYNSDTTKNLAKELAINLGIEYKVIGIEESVIHTKNQIEETFGKKIEGIVAENIQARDRGGRILAAVAANENAVFTNNGNKTEIALGYATLYGDVAGAISPIGDLYKTQVFELARYINTRTVCEPIPYNKRTGPEVIPTGIIDIVPSAELSDDQNVDAGMGDPIIYEYHDKIFYKLIEEREDIETILEKYITGDINEYLGMDKIFIEEIFESGEDFINDLEKIYKSFRINFFKRIQCPPIISVSKRAFGFDFREAQNLVYFTRKYRHLREEVIKS